jgi:CubicO group peptidase (beta-lactamase class C family)
VTGSPLLRSLAVLLVIGASVVSWSYWQDPPFWRRWWNVLTHLSPDHMDFRPTVAIGGGPVRELPAAQGDGQTISSAALREAERYAPGWDRNRLTQSQSMMKTLAALALGAAIADGHIRSVDEPVATYLPEWAGDPRGAIRIRDFLQMATGLAQARFTLNPFARDSAFRFLNSADREAVYLRTPAVNPPAREFDYNDLDAALIGLIVQRATGEPWARWLDRKIWRPIGDPSATHRRPAGRGLARPRGRHGHDSLLHACARNGLGPCRTADERPGAGAWCTRVAGRVDRRDDDAVAAVRGLWISHLAGCGYR